MRTSYGVTRCVLRHRQSGVSWTQSIDAVKPLLPPGGAGSMMPMTPPISCLGIRTIHVIGRIRGPGTALRELYTTHSTDTPEFATKPA